MNTENKNVQGNDSNPNVERKTENEIFPSPENKNFDPEKKEEETGKNDNEVDVNDPEKISGNEQEIVKVEEKKEIDNNQQKIEVKDDAKKVSSIPVVRNDSQQKIIFLSGNKSWTIHKEAQIPLTSIPLWVKQHPEFQGYRRDKMLVYINIEAKKQQL